MNFLIGCFNKEYKWEGMFNISDAKDRIDRGHILFILYYDKEPIGYVWFKELDDTTCFGYNLYVTKQVKRPRNSPKWFYSRVSEIMIEKYESINVEIEDWNSIVIDMVECIGYNEKLSPHPHVRDAEGLAHVNPFPFSPSE